MESKLEEECRSGSNGEVDKSLRLPSGEPDLANIILCSDSDHKDDKENKDGKGRFLDVQRDDLASRRVRMNQTKVRVSGLPVPSTCNSKDRELWERIRLSAQLSVLKRMEDLKQQKMRAKLENKEPTPTTTGDHQESESEELQSDQGKDDRSARSQAQRLNWPPEQHQAHGKSSVRERTGHDGSVRRDGQEVGKITQDKKLRKQHDGLLEYKDQWQDDLARWKNRRHQAGQEPIRKEEERKTVEKLMTTDESLHSIKSYKIYKEIVEKEHEEQELHQPSTPDKMATVLEKLQLLPADSRTLTGALNADQWEDHLVRWKNRRRRTCEDLIRKEVRKMVEKLMMAEGTNQTSYKPVKNSGLMRVNGYCGDGLFSTPVTVFLATQKPEEQLSPAGDAAFQKSTQTPSTIINDQKAKVTKEEGPNCPQMKRCKDVTSTSTVSPEKTAVETRMIMDSCEVRLHCKDDQGDRADAAPDTSHCRSAQYQPGIMEGF